METGSNMLRPQRWRLFLFISFQKVTEQVKHLNFNVLWCKVLNESLHWSWLSETLLISVATWCCTMALSHVVFLPDSMQTGQHSPAGVKGKWQSVMGQVISSQTTRPPAHRQVTQGFGDQTARSNMVRPWYTHWPSLPEAIHTHYSHFSSSQQFKYF